MARTRYPTQDSLVGLLAAFGVALGGWALDEVRGVLRRRRERLKAERDRKHDFRIDADGNIYRW